jgi:hypothetical protein
MPKKPPPPPTPPGGKRKSKIKPKMATGSAEKSPRPKPRLGRDEKLLKRFYEPLALQHALSEARGTGPPCHGDHILRDGQDESEMDHRHSLVDMLAYVCDYQKGGETVTAIALEQRLEGVVFWIATNEGVEEKVTRFLKELLQSLADLDGAVAKASEKMTLKRIVEFGKKRLEAYWKIVQRLSKRCQEVLSRSGGDRELITHSRI